MKIAVLSDIHANATALDAVLADAAGQQVDSYAVAGDLITDGPDTMQVLERIRALDCAVIKGNREDYILRYRNGERPDWKGNRQMAAVLWTNENLDAEGFEYLTRLPEQAVLELGDGMALRLVHGSPFSMYELLKPHENMAAVERAALAVDEQALVFGHNHIQWTGSVHGRLLLNPGSVGVHFNRHCMAEYAILTCVNGRLSAELRLVPYDFSELERRLETSGLTDAAPVWTKITFESVKAGRNYNLWFLNDGLRAMREEGCPPGVIPNDIWHRVADAWWTKMGWGPCPE